MVVKQELRKLGLHFVVVNLGEIEILEEISATQKQRFKEALARFGLELMDDKKSTLIEKIKIVVVELVHYTDDSLKINFSHHLSEKLNYDYTYLANLFSQVEGITIEQFVIIHKIERVKELLVYDELSLKEISYKLHYSSVAHLSSQFKRITGLSPSHFKKLKNYRRTGLVNLGDISTQ
ncbi:MAG TPA: helix-turn-helix domain-containing protein [Sphingobacteriaceae bacterium]